MDVKTAGRTVQVFELFSQKQQPLSLSGSQSSAEHAAFELSLSGTGARE